MRARLKKPHWREEAGTGIRGAGRPGHQHSGSWGLEVGNLGGYVLGPAWWVARHQSSLQFPRRGWNWEPGGGGGIGGWGGLDLEKGCRDGDEGWDAEPWDGGREGG